MEDVNNSFREMDRSIDSASKELNNIWTKKQPVLLPKEMDEKLYDMKKKREILWKKVKMYK